MRIASAVIPLALAVPFAGCTAPGEVPLWHVGDTWEYLRASFDPASNLTTRATITLTVVSASGTVGGQPVYTARQSFPDTGGSVTRNYTQNDLNEIDGRNEVRTYAFPLASGKGWEGRAGYEDGNATIQARVVREMTETVPAGRFRAFLIESRVTLTDAAGVARGELRQRVLFAPDAGNALVIEEEDLTSGAASRTELQRFARS